MGLATDADEQSGTNWCIKTLENCTPRHKNAKKRSNFLKLVVT